MSPPSNLHPPMGNPHPKKSREGNDREVSPRTQQTPSTGEAGAKSQAHEQQEQQSNPPVEDDHADSAYRVARSQSVQSSSIFHSARTSPEIPQAFLEQATQQQEQRHEGEGSVIGLHPENHTQPDTAALSSTNGDRSLKERQASDRCLQEPTQSSSLGSQDQQRTSQQRTPSSQNRQHAQQKREDQQGQQRLPYSPQDLHAPSRWQASPGQPHSLAGLIGCGTFLAFRDADGQQQVLLNSPVYPGSQESQPGPSGFEPAFPAQPHPQVNSDNAARGARPFRQPAPVLPPPYRVPSAPPTPPTIGRATFRHSRPAAWEAASQVIHNTITNPSGSDSADSSTFNHRIPWHLDVVQEAAHAQAYQVQQPTTYRYQNIPRWEEVVPELVEPYTQNYEELERRLRRRERRRERVRKRQREQQQQQQREQGRQPEREPLQPEPSRPVSQPYTPASPPRRNPSSPTKRYLQAAQYAVRFSAAASKPGPNPAPTPARASTPHLTPLVPSAAVRFLPVRTLGDGLFNRSFRGFAPFSDWQHRQSVSARSRTWDSGWRGPATQSAQRQEQLIPSSSTRVLDPTRPDILPRARANLDASSTLGPTRHGNRNEELRQTPMLSSASSSEPLLSHTRESGALESTLTTEQTEELAGLSEDVVTNGAEGTSGAEDCDDGEGNRKEDSDGVMEEVSDKKHYGTVYCFR